MSDGNGHDYVAMIHKVETRLGAEEDKGRMRDVRMDDWNSILKKSHNTIHGDQIKAASAYKQQARAFTNQADELIKLRGEMRACTAAIGELNTLIRETLLKKTTRSKRK